MTLEDVIFYPIFTFLVVTMFNVLFWGIEKLARMVYDNRTPW